MNGNTIDTELRFFQVTAVSNLWQQVFHEALARHEGRLTTKVIDDAAILADTAVNKFKTVSA